MKVYRKIILDKNNKVVYEDSYDYEGTWSYLGIHYDFKSTRGAKAMEKQAKRDKKLAEKRAKKQAKTGFPKEEEDKTIPWVRVYKLPDYIFMSHKKHVEPGVTCKICHGPVSKRDILKKEVSTSMKFCMECHQSRGASIECNLCHELNQ